ncbi:hypothetical protein TNCV_896971 [Trichonephila clavipes]|nr:hypothetical protein TNCV_896971 [Trichonephila clavipes]
MLILFLARKCISSICAWSFSTYSSGTKGASGDWLNRRSAGRRRYFRRASGIGNIRWSRERHSCRQAGKRVIPYPSPVDYWIPGERGCSGWFD